MNNKKKNSVLFIPPLVDLALVELPWNIILRTLKKRSRRLATDQYTRGGHVANQRWILYVNFVIQIFF